MKATPFRHSVTDLQSYGKPAVALEAVFKMKAGDIAVAEIELDSSHKKSHPEFRVGFFYCAA